MEKMMSENPFPKRPRFYLDSKVYSQEEKVIVNLFDDYLDYFRDMIKNYLKLEKMRLNKSPNDSQLKYNIERLEQIKESLTK